MKKTPETPQEAIKESTLHPGLLIDETLLTTINGEASVLYSSLHNLDALQQLAENVKSKYGPGTRLYGFIEKTKDVAMASPNFSPALFSAIELARFVDQLEQLRNLKDLLDMAESIAKNLLILTTHEAYQQALLYYHSVSELAKRNVSGAKAIYDELRQYFERTARLATEPTRKQLERDMHALLDGTKDGKIVIENQRPQTTGGTHTVVDDTRKDHSAFRASVDEEVK